MNLRNVLFVVAEHRPQRLLHIMAFGAQRCSGSAVWYVDEYLCASRNFGLDLLASPTECDFDGAVELVIEDVWALLVQVDGENEFLVAV